MAPDQALWALFAAAALMALAGLLRYRTLLNPLTVSTITDTGLTTLLPGVFAYQFLSLGKYSEGDVVKTAALSGVYLIGISLPYLTRRSALAHFFSQALTALGLNSPGIARQFSVVKFGFLLLGATFSFAALAVAGGGGTLWLTDPRLAYLLYLTNQAVHRLNNQNSIIAVLIGGVIGWVVMAVVGLITAALFIGSAVATGALGR